MYHRIDAGVEVKREPYTYAILRYRHDPVADERVNVGVVLFSPARNFIAARINSGYGRLKKLFPDLIGSALKKDLNRIRREFDKLEKSSVDGLFSNLKDARKIALEVVGADDSSLVWSDVGAGVSDDPAKVIESLYHRFVIQYDDASPHRKQDADVWRPFRDLLLERKIDQIFEKKTIRSKHNEVEFEHAWKNGVWHCIQPLSFDLTSEEGIQEKAARWVGNLVGLSKGEEKFKPYFLVGEPAKLELEMAYKKALDFLADAPGEPMVILDTDVVDFANEFEDKFRNG